MALTAKKVYAILKRQISDMEAKLNSPVRYRGTVATADLLPLNPDIGDMYNIESKSVYGEAGMNVAWNGVVWDTMGAPIDMSLYLTKEEAEAVIQRLVTEYFEKNPVKPGATTEQAQQIEQNKTDIASLKVETGSLKEDLSTKITKFYASSQGKPHLADSDNGKIMDMMLYGRSEQKQYSGKNLLKPHTVKSETLHGVTCTYNNDGTVSLKGTAENNNADFYYFGAFTGTEVIPNIDKTKTYTLAGTGTSKIQLFTSGLGNSTNGTSITGKGTNIFYVMYRVPNGIIVDTTIYPQLELGTEATSYEPYVGGQPSPSPDYPQEIKSVVNPTVKVCGKNLLNYDAWKETPITNGTAVFENNGITITATQTDSYTEHSTKVNKPFPIDAQIKVNEGEVVTLSWEADNKDGDIYIFGNESEFVLVNNNNAKKLSYTVPNGITFITFRFGVANKGDTISYKNIQIEKGSTATSYEPYHEQTVTLPYTLNAIPVNSGGNVTIDGQQYIADYVDVERGKLVRMCKEHVITGSERLAMYWLGNASYLRNVCCINNFENIVLYDGINPLAMSDMFIGKISKNADDERAIYLMLRGSGDKTLAIKFLDSDGITTVDLAKQWLIEHKPKIVIVLSTPTEIDLTPEEIAAFKALATYYPITNISVNSEQLDGYTVFNYPISMANGWNYIKKQLNDNRDYIYDMDTQSAEAYVNSEYAVALTELEV